jgi:hypothetical protein
MRRSILDKQHYGFYKDRPVPDMLFLLVLGMCVLAWINNYKENDGDYKIVVCSGIVIFLILFRIFLHRRFFPLRPLVRIDERGITVFSKTTTGLIPFKNSAFVIFGIENYSYSPSCKVKVAYFDGKVIETSLPLDAIELDRLQLAIEKFRPKKLSANEISEDINPNEEEETTEQA